MPRGGKVRATVFLCSLPCVTPNPSPLPTFATGLLVVSTRVGGVPEVLPEEMLILAEPSAAGLVDAVEQALGRVGGVDPLRQHQQVRHMYSWERITQRTERVYRRVVEEAGGGPGGGSLDSRGASTEVGCLHQGSVSFDQQQQQQHGLREDSLVGRLRRYHKCGKWFGKICCCIAAVDWLYWRWLEWLQPAGRFDPEPDFPNPFTHAQHGKPS